MTGSGTLLDPYVIYDVNDLQNMNLDLTAYYELGQDIDASATVGWNAGLGFLPVGQDSPLHDPALRFSGYFDGKGYKITNLCINRPAEDEGVGLFGCTAANSTGYIRNVGLENVDITGESNVGGLVGFHEYMLNIADGIISNCWVTGNVRGSRVLVGGLVGYSGALIQDCWVDVDVALVGGAVGHIHECGGFIGLSDRAIERCYSLGDVSAVHTVPGKDIEEIGGFIGLFENGYIRQCFATGNVTVIGDAPLCKDVYRIGGFAGITWGLGGTSDCYAKGDVTVTPGSGIKSWVGGLSGYNLRPMDNCYSTGLVSAIGFTFVGGLVGRNTGSVTDCFWDTETSGMLVSAGGTGKTTAQMKTASTFTDAGWDFTTIWTICGGVNNDYPCLLGVTPSCVLAPVVPYVINKSYALAREEL